MNLAVATMIPVSEWRAEALRDLRTITTAERILEEQEKRAEGKNKSPGAISSSDFE